MRLHNTEAIKNLDHKSVLLLLANMTSWHVYIGNNYYSGRYHNYRFQGYTVIANSAVQARQIVLDNADEILSELMLRKISGRNLLSRKSVVKISRSTIGNIVNGTIERKITTSGYREYFCSTGKISVKLLEGYIDITDNSKLKENNYESS